MSLETLFKSAVSELRRRQIPFAVAGGLAADLYRSEPRLTMDVDIVILIEAHALELAIAVVEKLGLKAGVVRQADLAGGPLFAIRRRSTAPCMVVGRAEGKRHDAGVDILLPALPWAREAATRAQSNLVDFGFSPVPALRLEDVVLAKLYALTAAQMRAKDLDDLQSIFAANHALDWPYLAGQIQKLGLTIPKLAKPFLPPSLLKIARRPRKGS